jgi:hypothetical protein
LALVTQSLADKRLYKNIHGEVVTKTHGPN